MKHKITAKIGDEVFIKIAKGKDYSTYRIRITRDDFEGSGLEDVFLAESTGYTPEDED